MYSNSVKALLVSAKCLEAEADLNTSSALSSCDSNSTFWLHIVYTCGNFWRATDGFKLLSLEVLQKPAGRENSCTRELQIEVRQGRKGCCPHPPSTSVIPLSLATRDSFLPSPGQQSETCCPPCNTCSKFSNVAADLTFRTFLSTLRRSADL